MTLIHYTANDGSHHVEHVSDALAARLFAAGQATPVEAHSTIFKGDKS